MFDAIRDKISNFQENLSTTLRGLSVVEKQPSWKQTNKTIAPVNFNAGTAVLENFQSHWCELHKMSQENATKAEKVDELILNLQKSADKQWKGVSHLTGILISLPDIVKAVNDLYGRVVDLEVLFEEVNNGLFQMEEVLDMRDYDNKVMEQKLQLALHEQTRLAQLESLRSFLDEKFREKLKLEDAKKQLYVEHELNFPKDKTLLESNTDIKLEKQIERGDHKDNSKDSNQLDSIILENDNADILEDFLNEDVGKPEDKKNNDC